MHYKQTCVILNETINSARNVKITMLDDAYTLTDNQLKFIEIEHLAPQSSYNFSLNRDPIVLDIEFSEVKVEWDDNYKKHNEQIIIIQVPKQNGFLNK